MSIVRLNDKRNCFAACPQPVINAGRCVCNNRVINAKETSRKSQETKGLKKAL